MGKGVGLRLIAMTAIKREGAIFSNRGRRHQSFSSAPSAVYCTDQALALENLSQLVTRSPAKILKVTPICL